MCFFPQCLRTLLTTYSTAVTLAMFSCTGGEIVAMTAGEARAPWRDVPLAMSFAYIVPLAAYPFILLAGGANVNFADPSLPKVWSRGTGVGSQSPFVIAAQTSALHGLPKALNLFFIISAYTAGYLSYHPPIMLSRSANRSQ